MSSVSESFSRFARTAQWLSWFAAGLLALLVFAFVVIPWLQRFGPAREIKRVVLENDIDATGLFYTEVEETANAEVWIRNSLNRNTGQKR